MSSGPVNAADITSADGAQTCIIVDVADLPKLAEAGVTARTLQTEDAASGNVVMMALMRAYDRRLVAQLEPHARAAWLDMEVRLATTELRSGLLQAFPELAQGV